MALILETFCVDLVDILGAGWTSGKPSCLRYDLESADLGVVARRSCELGGDGLSCQLRFFHRVGRQFAQLCLLLRIRCSIDSRVVRHAKFFYEFCEVLA